MKKNGFTLIELLAVIVILAVIALITTPIVMTLVRESKESAIISSAEFYIDAVDYSVMNREIAKNEVEDGIYNILENGNVCLEYKDLECSDELVVEASGDRPNSGTVTIRIGKTIDINLNYDGKIVVKENNKLVFDGENTNNNNNNNNNIPEPVSFEADDWSTIIANVKAGNIDVYKDDIGQIKTITLTGYDSGLTGYTGLTYGSIVAGDYKVRLANTSTPAECSGEGFSETACGFVIEFVDIITTHVMNSTVTNAGGWPASEMYTYVNETIYAALDPVVKEAIIDTTVVSGHGYNDDSNFVTTDKIYLLSTQEVWGSNLSYDTANAETRQLDYYKDYENTDGSIGVTTSKYSGAKKYLNGTANSIDANNFIYWWLRSAFSIDTNNFYYVSSSGYDYSEYAYVTCGVAAAFRLG